MLVPCPMNNLPFCVPPTDICSCNICILYIRVHRGQLLGTVCRGIAQLLLKRVTPQMAPKNMDVHYTDIAGANIGWRLAQPIDFYRRRERVSRPTAML